MSKSMGSTPEILAELVETLNLPSGGDALMYILDAAEAIMEDDIDSETEEATKVLSWQIMDLLRDLADEFGTKS